MGDSRSWGAEKEDEIVMCKHNEPSLYFDTCQCAGCKEDRRFAERLKCRVDDVRDMVWKVYAETPECDWDKVVSIRIKNKAEPEHFFHKRSDYF